MKAVILAAGEGKRLRPLTIDKPKPMVEVLGRPLLHHIIDSLPKEITELILVVGYKAEAIKEYFGDRFEGRKITYVAQDAPKGSAHALFLAKPFIKKGEKFLAMFADDLHSPRAIEKLIRHNLAVLVARHADPTRFGVIVTDAKGNIASFEEKPKQPKSNLVWVGVSVFDDRIFRYELVKHQLGEYFIPEVVQQLLKDHAVAVEETDFWHPISSPQHIEAAEAILDTQNHRPNDTPVFIIAGGKGTRMPESEKDKPKVLVEIAGKPMLHWQFEELRKQGFSDITLSLGYRADMVVDWLERSGNKDVRYAIESEPLGTGGGLKLAAKEAVKPFIAINADDIADVNFRSLIRHGGGRKWNVLTGFGISDARAFGLLKCDEFKKICSFEEKKPDATEGGLVNIGHYYLLPEIFEGTPKAFSLERDVFPKLAAAGKLLLHEHAGYWLPTGTPEQLATTREYFAKAHAPS